MGWVSAGGTLMDVEAWFLASLLYLWQMPHFFALSWMYRADYQRGGFQMISRNDPLGSTTSSLILRYTTYLSTLPLLSTACGITSSMFALESIVFNSVALRVAYQFTKDRTTANARNVFLTSLWYLPCWMMLFLLHAKKKNNNKLEDGDGNIDKLERSMIQQGIELIRQKGKEHCIHEQVVYGGSLNTTTTISNILPRTTAIAETKTKGEESCPLILGKDAVVKVSAKALETATTVVAVAEAASSSSHSSANTGNSSTSSSPSTAGAIS